MSHEHNESITDPIPNDAWTQGYGGPNSTHGEENDGHVCLNSLTLPTLGKATFTSTAGTSLAMNFNATGSGPSIADFSWQFNDSAPGCTLTCNNTIETTAPTISHTFPATGDYSVGLAVFQANGTSMPRRDHRDRPQRVRAGLHRHDQRPESILQGPDNITEQAVTSYLWEFGDGSTGIGAAPSHTYATAGTYSVTVVEFSGIGSAFPGSGAAPIYARAITVT